MSKEWFSEKLDSLGLPEMGHVYDYLAQLPDGEVESYLGSLIGSNADAASVTRQFLSVRRKEQAEIVSTASDQSLLPQRSMQPQRDGHRKYRGRGASQANRARLPTRNADPRASSVTSSKDREPSAPSHVGNMAKIAKKIQEYHESREPINCLKCGFIEFHLQLDGKCAFCASPMFMDERESGTSATDLMLAEEQKNVLLSYDRSDAQRTRVLDDDSEYFDASSGNWMSQDERRAAERKRAEKEQQQRNRPITVTIDLSGRKIIDESRNETEHAQDSGARRSLGSNVVQNQSNGGQAYTPSTDESGVFVNPQLRGSGPRFVLDKQCGEEWLAISAHTDAPSSSERVQREEGFS